MLLDPPRLSRLRWRAFGELDLVASDGLKGDKGGVVDEVDGMTPLVRPEVD